MTQEPKKSLITFGVAGAVGPNAAAALDRMLPSFRLTPKTVMIKWIGDDFFAAAYQHCEDTGLAPGTYEFPIPSIGDYQGIVSGQFFGRTNQPESESALSRPEKLCLQFLSNYASDRQEALLSLNGASVGVFWDQLKDQVHLIRDRLGITPLYTAKFDSEIVFSTDLRVFRSAIPEPLILDEQAIAEFLHFLYVPAPRSIYEGVRAVLPGHTLILDGQKSKQTRYCPPRFIPGDKIDDPDEVKKAIEGKLPEFEAHLRTTLTEVLPERGRVGLLLSGGKDSGTLAIALSQILPPERILAFTIGFERDEIDESRDAAQLCEFLKVPHQVYIPKSDELVDGVIELARGQDQPIGDPASLPLYLGLKHLPEDVDVLLDGSGTDYYFGFVKRVGWKYYHLRYQFQKLIPEFLWPYFIKLMALGPRKLRSLGSMWQMPIEEVFVNWHGWSATELTRLYGNEVSVEDTYLYQFIRQNASQDWQVLQTNVLFHIWEPNAAYRKVFHLGQQMGRSVRFPFIDNRLASFVNSLPQELKFDKFTNKILLRAYLAKYLPKELLKKPKGYFVFDLNELMKTQNHRWLRLLKDENRLKALPDWSDQAIEQLLVDFQGSPTQSDLYRLYSLALMSTWIATVEGQLG